MASTAVIANSPLASALESSVQQKIAELGWSSGAGDDSALSTYIVLMLVNGKTQADIAAELANDLLGLEPGDPTAGQFASWLLQEVENLHSQLNGGGPIAQSHPVQTTDEETQAPLDHDAQSETQDVAMDEEMNDAGEMQIPTGPKSMRSGAGNVKGREKRMLGQLKNAMDRSNDQALHRIRGAANAGRVARVGAEPPKGPKAMTRSTHNGPRPGMSNGPTANGANGPVTPQQQMQLLKMLEEQSRMMAQILGPGANQPAINPAFFGNNGKPAGKSLFERVKRPQGHNRSQSQGNGTHRAVADAGTGPNEESSRTPCKFQLRCTSAACPYAHQSPAAPPGVEVEVEDRCPFGAACKNRKCLGNHPSPAQKAEHLAATVECKFFPNCTNKACPFKHPDTAPCPRGADCPERDKECKLSHSDVLCRYTPCMNEHCRFRHVDGQRLPKMEHHVWTANGSGPTKTSDRKFTTGDDQDKEELILPGRMDVDTTAGNGGATGMDTQKVQQDVVA